MRVVQVGWIGVGQVTGLYWNRLLKRPGPAGPERLRVAFEKMSGSFLKFGQILSLQVDVIPRAYCDALLDLLDRVPPFPPQGVRQVFLEELGRPPEDLYREFDYRPFASASIGQVHKAVLEDSTEAAVKVQRPGVQQLFARDAVLLNAFVKVAFFLKIRSLYFMRDPVREFNEWIVDELDYRREATYADLLGKNALQTRSEKIPKIYWDLTTSRVLTMDFLHGYSVLEYLRIRERKDDQKLAELKELGFDPAVFVSNVITNFVSDALRFGIFHADLHPANLLILKGNRVGYVDFGIVGTLTPEARRKVIDLTLAYVQGRTADIYDSFMDISTLSEDPDLPGFRRELERRSRTWYREPAIGGIPRFGKSLTLAMIDLLTLCRSYGVLPNREMIRYIRSLFLADGLVTRLAPGLDFGDQLKELGEAYIAEEARGKVLSTDAALTLLADFSGWLQTGPGTMLRALERLERRQVRLQTRLTRRDPGQGALRTRTVMVALVWLAVVVTTGLSWPSVASAAFSFPGYVLIGFLAIWTSWLIYLLARLKRG